MKGKNAEFIALIRRTKPSVVDLGCVAHLTNLCNLYGSKSLPFQADDLITNIYYLLEKMYRIKIFMSINVWILVINIIFISTKPVETLKDYFSDFPDVEYRAILCHCPTR